MLMAAWLSVGAGTSLTYAQTPTPPVKPKLAYVRFWNMLSAKPPGNALELFEADDKILTIAAPGNCFADYLPVVPGTYTFSICRPKDIAHPLKRLPISVPADAFITILVSETDGQQIVEGLNDTVDPKTSDGSGQLVLRQYIDGAQVTASVGTAPPTAPIGYGATTVIDNLPTAQIVINVRATFVSGPAQTWTVPADLTTYHHGTLLIVPDAYGRFRPRFAVDGHAAEAPSAH